MRKSIAIIITSILVLSGCNKQQSVSDRLLNEVEKAIAINPDSASNLLKSISSPEKLDDKAFARWCMLSGKITDEIFNSILPTYQLERAYDWYSSHGSPDEQVQILIYLGRSYFADGDYDNKDIEVTASINNALGNIYVMREEYDKAEKYFLKALSTGKEKMPDYVALIDLYTTTDSIDKAKELLSKIPQDDPQYTCSINYLYYQIHNAERDYKEALAYLEEYVDMVDSIVYADSQSKILNIESKYNHLKISQEVDRLKIKQQSYIIFSVICISCLLLIMIVYLLYRKQAKEKIHRQQDELNRIKTDLTYVSLELEEKKKLLDTFKEKDDNYNKIEKEIALLTSNYKELQHKSLENSPTFKELVRLAKQNKPRNDKPLITDKQWELIADEITYIYPNLSKYLYSLCPNLPEQDFLYCCLCMCGFDTNTEAKLLNIASDSVRKKRFRLREKLNIALLNDNTTLYEYLIENMH
ncbi:hypothetical protein NXW25_26560 [Bacteroides ovatus]|nr:hypothetical protein [Bacteroides ovatus]